MREHITYAPNRQKAPRVNDIINAGSEKLWTGKGKVLLSFLKFKFSEHLITTFSLSLFF